MSNVRYLILTREKSLVGLLHHMKLILMVNG